MHTKFNLYFGNLVFNLEDEKSLSKYNDIMMQLRQTLTKSGIKYKELKLPK